MPDETKPTPAAFALAFAAVVAAWLVLSAVFQVCWNHGFAHVVNGPQINYWPAVWTVLGLLFISGLIRAAGE